MSYLSFNIIFLSLPLVYLLSKKNRLNLLAIHLRCHLVQYFNSVDERRVGLQSIMGGRLIMSTYIAHPGGELWTV